MAKIYKPLIEADVKQLTIANLRKEYYKFTESYTKITSGKLLKCNKCCDDDEFLSEEIFYSDNNYKNGRFPICKRCLMMMVEQRENKNDQPNETPESVQKVLQMMDLPYIDSFYRDCIKGAEDGVKEKNRKSPWGTYITALKSLPNWKGMTWKDSDFGDSLKDSEEETRIVQKTIKNAKKRFGSGYSDTDYMFLENEYQDWISRYKCDSKAQEEVFESLSSLKLQKRNAIKANKPQKDIKEIDASIQSWLDTGNLKPKQNTGNALIDSLTFGQLIEKWEMEEPIPEPDPMFKDVDNIGKKLRVFFSGHLSRVLGLDNGYAKEYDEYMKKYTVEKPKFNGVSSNGDTTIYNKLFGGNGDE